ncbi:phage regulatory CII family protein [Bordetella bronchialis]|uniref:Uncharacterized protein n=1 Tax=Bordetella bronchialis TaxID=463025 RepID=A0A193FW05_9BORD|nr:phage regulatory CII family protein [Bordetella bronchialis]ANN71533.1 hypothetical protein BAU08_09460 [Bordetella bronchialis]
MNTTDAAYATVHDYPGGSESLGPRVGVSPAVLRNKVNPQNDTHRLAWDEAVRISVVTGDARMLDAFAAELGRVTVPIPAAGVSDMDVLADTCSLVTQVGQYMQTIHTALSDGKVDQKEIKAIRQQALEAMSKVATLVACLEGMAE